MTCVLQCENYYTALCIRDYQILIKKTIIHKHNAVTATSSDWNISLNQSNSEAGMTYVVLEVTIVNQKNRLVEHRQLELKSYSEEIVFTKFFLYFHYK